MTNKSKKVLKIKEKIKKYKSMIKLEKFENPGNNDKCKDNINPELCRINEDIKAQNEALDNYKDGREGIAIALIVCVFFSMIFGGYAIFKIASGDIALRSHDNRGRKRIVPSCDGLRCLGYIFWPFGGKNTFFTDRYTKFPRLVGVIFVLCFITFPVLTGILFSNKNGDEWRTQVKALEKDESGQNCVYNKKGRCDLETFKEKAKDYYHCRGLISDAEVNEGKGCHNKNSPPHGLHVKITEYLLYGLAGIWVIALCIGLIARSRRGPKAVGEPTFIENKNNMTTSREYALYSQQGRWNNGIVWNPNAGEWRSILPDLNLEN
jgi:hypothetical protein